jgi:hypothetical protein
LGVERATVDIFASAFGFLSLFFLYFFGLREELAQFCFVSGLVWLV